MNRHHNISRRELLRGRLVAKGHESTKTTPDAPSSMVMRYPRTTEDASPAVHRSIPLHRPPGAVDERTFLAECTRCNACVDACPHDAIIHASLRFRQAAGTPMIDPDQQPCLMCDDVACIDACEPNVLSRAIPIMMGTARITPQTCLAHNNQICTVCSEHCPVEGAIEFRKGKPHINEDACTGCGVCRFVCPSPENAILLMPTFTRPTRNSGLQVAPGDDAHV